jgi:hypothetical protein
MRWSVLNAEAHEEGGEQKQIQKIRHERREIPLPQGGIGMTGKFKGDFKGVKKERPRNSFHAGVACGHADPELKGLRQPFKGEFKDVKKKWATLR